MLDAFLHYLTRKKNAVNCNDLTRVKPLSSVFGLDRGTPIDRYYIEGFLERNAELIKGRVLEVGESRYSERFGSPALVSIDVLHAVPQRNRATIVGDLTDRATLPASSFDCFICTQTFNFIFEVQKAVEGAHHLLKPGGTLLATVAGISQISRYDMERWGDYWRFTTASLQRLFEPVFGASVTVASHGNLPMSLAFLQGVAVEDLPEPALLENGDSDYQLLLTVVARKEDAV